MTRRVPPLVVVLLLTAVPSARLAAQVGRGIRRTARGARRGHRLGRRGGVRWAVQPVNYWPTFQQHASFLYLTGFEEPDAVLVLVKRGGRTEETLFVPPADARLERWVGNRTSPGEVARLTGMPGRLLAEFRPAVDSLVAAGLPLFTISDVQTYDYARQDSLTKGKAFATDVARRGPVPMSSLDTVLAKLRATKSPAELALLRRAVDVSVVAHQQAMRAVAPGCGEYEIQALVDGTFRRLGADGPSYGSIVGSGPNSTVLHYMEDSRVMQAGELLVLDAGRRSTTTRPT